MARTDNPLQNKPRALMSWVRRGLWAGAIGAGLLLLAAYLWPATRRFDAYELRCVSFAAFAVRTLVFHFGVGFALLTLAATVFRARRLAIGSGLTGAAMLGPIALTYAPPIGGSPESDDVLVVYSANVYVGRADVGALAAQVREHDADIVLIQEATPGFAERLREELGAEYPYIVEASRNGAYGQITLSRRPFVGEADHYPQGDLADRFDIRPGINAADPQIRVAVEHAGRELVIQNVHLTSPGGVEAVAEQLEQARWLGGWIDTEDRPVLMMGDFNCTPTSAHAGLLRRAGWRDAFRQTGRGRGATWPARGVLSRLPGVRIDHAYTANGLEAIETRVLEARGSDHRPVVVRLVVGD